jgi:hypothetical protein
MDILPIINFLHEASHSVDVLTINGDVALGMNANFFLAALHNTNCKIRYIQSKNEAINNNPTIDDILFSFGGNAQKAYIYNHTKYSCIIIDKKIGFYLDELNVPSIDSILDLQSDITQLLSDFETLWEANYKQLKIKSVSDIVNSFSYLNYRRGDILFRGQCNSEWQAIPKIFRGEIDDVKLFELESLKSIFTRNNNAYLNNFDPLNYFVVRQHYGSPTRLLDLTRDIFIGLFFACYDPLNHFTDKDGKLYLLEYSQYSNITFNGPHLDVFKNIPNKESIRYYQERIFFNEPVILEPIIKNPRMRYQEGLFMLFPLLDAAITYSSLEEFNRFRNKDIAEDDKKFWLATKLIDKQFKNSILKELKDYYGIDETTIFPITTLDTNH